MSINCYTGLMGSGKTFEVVSSVIVPALAKGRRVVANIAGINNDACRAYCHERMGVPLGDVGHIVEIKNDRVLEPNFFPHSEIEVNGLSVVADRETVVKGGDLVALDEAWRFWPTGSKLPQEHMVFFREHRHYANSQTGVTCDLVMMVQDVSDLLTKVKVVIEMTFRTKKLKSLGLHRFYVVDYWEGFAMKGKPLGSRKKVYDKSVFPLYTSYAGTAGAESVVDNRQNVFKSPMFWFCVVVVLMIAPLSAWRVWKFFHQEPKTIEAAATATPAASSAEGSNSGSSMAGTAKFPSPSASGTSGPALTAGPSYSQEWRIVGFAKRGGQLVVAVKGAPDMPLRYLPASRFVFDGGRPVSGNVDNQVVTDFSGGSVGQAMKGGQVK